MYMPTQATALNTQGLRTQANESVSQFANSSDRDQSDFYNNKAMSIDKQMGQIFGMSSL